MTGKRGSIVGFGELLWDILPTGPVIGGAPANFAYRAQSLGRPSYVISAVGNDEFGNRAIGALSERGVNTEYVQRDPSHPTGTVTVTLSPSGDASYVIHPDVAYDHIRATPVLRALVESCDVFCFGTLVQRHPDTRRALYELLDATKAVKVVDVNLRRDCFSAETVRESLARADIVKLNDEEVGTVSNLLGLGVSDIDAFAKAVIQRFNVDTCLVTLGARGVWARAKDQEPVYARGYSVSVVDTVGSGDSFTAAFMDARLRGQPLAACCDFGNRIGALVAGREGGMSPIGEQEIAQFSLSHHALEVPQGWRQFERGISP